MREQGSWQARFFRRVVAAVTGSRFVGTLGVGVSAIAGDPVFTGQAAARTLLFTDGHDRVLLFAGIQSFCCRLFAARGGKSCGRPGFAASGTSYRSNGRLSGERETDGQTRIHTHMNDVPYYDGFFLDQARSQLTAPYAAAPAETPAAAPGATL